MFGLTAFFFMVEISVGYFTNSMALLADSFHMLSDVAALTIAFLSIRMSPKKWSKNTFGWARAEVLGALVNAVFLSAMCFSILIEALKRFLQVEPIRNPMLIVVVGSIGLLVNIIGLFLFQHHGHARSKDSGSSQKLNNSVSLGGDGCSDRGKCVNTNQLETVKCVNNSSEQLNMKGVFLHVLADAMGSVIVVLSATVIWLTDWPYRFYIDPALSVIMVVIILRSVWPLLRDSSLILLQTVPTHIEVEMIERKLLEKVDGVLGIHEFHIWQLAGDRIIASAHIRCRNLSEYMMLAGKVKEFFHNEGIHSTTIQPEFTEVDDDLVDCMLDCPDAYSCSFSTCCGRTRERSQTPPMLCRQRSISDMVES